MRALRLAALALALTACDDAADPAPAGDASDGCPERGDCYTVGLDRAGPAGMTVRFLDAQPAPPAQGDNVWAFEIRDAGDAPMPGCAITLVPLMPDHGHGANTQPVVTEEGDGRYRAEPLDLFMRGLWTVDFDLDCGGQTDALQFSFWIEG